MLVHRRVTPSSKFAGTHLYTWVERGTMRVKCLAQEHNAVSRPGLEPGPPDPESSVLTIRPPRLPPGVIRLHVNASYFSTTAERVTSPTRDPLPPCKQALNRTTARAKQTIKTTLYYSNKVDKYSHNKYPCLLCVFFKHCPVIIAFYWSFELSFNFPVSGSTRSLSILPRLRGDSLMIFVSDKYVDIFPLYSNNSKSKTNHQNELVIQIRLTSHNKSRNPWKAHDRTNLSFFDINRRSINKPLVYDTSDWSHRKYLGGS